MALAYGVRAHRHIQLIQIDKQIFCVFFVVVVVLLLLL